MTYVLFFLAGIAFHIFLMKKFNELPQSVKERFKSVSLKNVLDESKMLWVEYSFLLNPFMPKQVKKILLQNCLGYKEEDFKILENYYNKRNLYVN
jgi:hypothetical protein